MAAGLPKLSGHPVRDIRLGHVSVALPTPSTAGLTPDDPGKETEHWFETLHSRNVLANSKPLVRSAIGRIKVRAPDDTKIFFPYYERVKNMKHATDTLVDSGQESDALYAYGSDGEECEVEMG